MRSVLLVATLLISSVACFAQSPQQGPNGSILVTSAAPEIFHRDADFNYGVEILLDNPPLSADQNLLVALDGVYYLVSVTEFKRRIETTTANLGTLTALPVISPARDQVMRVYMNIPLDSSMIKRWAARQQQTEAQLVAAGKKKQPSHYADIDVVYGGKHYELSLEQFKNRIPGTQAIPIGGIVFPSSVSVSESWLHALALSRRDSSVGFSPVWGKYSERRPIEPGTHGMEIGSN